MDLFCIFEGGIFKVLHIHYRWRALQKWRKTLYTITVGFFWNLPAPLPQLKPIHTLLLHIGCFEVSLKQHGGDGFFYNKTFKLIVLTCDDPGIILNSLVPFNKKSDIPFIKNAYIKHPRLLEFSYYPLHQTSNIDLVGSYLIFAFAQLLSTLFWVGFLVFAVWCLLFQWGMGWW